jgi:hypothetical protein
MKVIITVLIASIFIACSPCQDRGDKDRHYWVIMKDGSKQWFYRAVKGRDGSIWVEPTPCSRGQGGGYDIGPSAWQSSNANSY